jgi:hypothetical protein
MMGQWHYFQKDFVKAEPLLERALAIAEKEYAPDHPMLAVHFFYLGDFYQDARMNRADRDIKGRATITSRIGNPGKGVRP